MSEEREPLVEEADHVVAEEVDHVVAESSTLIERLRVLPLVTAEKRRPLLVDHVVLESDTLSGLCIRYGVRPRDLKKHNPSFDGRSLRGCDVLIVPWTRGERQNVTREVNVQKFRAATHLDRRSAAFYLDAANGDLDEAFGAKRRDDVFESTVDATGEPRIAVVTTSGVGLAVARRIACAWTPHDSVYLLGTDDDVELVAGTARQYSHAQLFAYERRVAVDVLVIDAELQDAARHLEKLLPDLRPGGRCVVVVPQLGHADPDFARRVATCYDMRSVASCIPGDQDQNAIALVELVRAAATWARHETRDIFINACELYPYLHQDYWLDPNAADVLAILGINELAPSNNSNQEEGANTIPRTTGQLFRRNMQVEPPWRRVQDKRPSASFSKKVLSCPCTIFASRRHALTYEASKVLTAV